MSSYLAASFCQRSMKAICWCEPRCRPASRYRGLSKFPTQIEKSLREFPEVETVVAKIGRAELGGDPESVSNDEMYVRLKPKEQWTTARTKDELVDAMRHRVGGFSRRRV